MEEPPKTGESSGIGSKKIIQWQCLAGIVFNESFPRHAPDQLAFFGKASLPCLFIGQRCENLGCDGILLLLRRQFAHFCQSFLEQGRHNPILATEHTGSPEQITLFSEPACLPLRRSGGGVMLDRTDQNFRGNPSLSWSPRIIGRDNARCPHIRLRLRITPSRWANA